VVDTVARAVAVVVAPMTEALDAMAAKDETAIVLLLRTSVNMGEVLAEILERDEEAAVCVRVIGIAEHLMMQQLVQSTMSDLHEKSDATIREVAMADLPEETTRTGEE